MLFLRQTLRERWLAHYRLHLNVYSCPVVELDYSLRFSSGRCECSMNRDVHVLTHGIDNATVADTRFHNCVRNAGQTTSHKTKSPNPLKNMPQCGLKFDPDPNYFL